MDQGVKRKLTLALAIAGLVVFFGVLIFMAAGLIVVALLDRLERAFDRWRPGVGARE